MNAPLDLLARRLRDHARRAGTPEDDAALLTAFVRSRDDSAFEAIVRRHGPMVLGVCRRVFGDADGADDAFQATFLVLARRAADVDPPRLAGWLHGVARRAAREARRSALRRRKREKAMSDPPDSPVRDPDVWGDVRAILDEEIAALPEAQRLAVVLCDLEGVTRREAASRLGIGDGTLSHRLNAAHARLASRLSSRGVALSATALAAMFAAHAQAAPVPASLVASAVSGLVSENALALTSILVKSMLTGKLKMLAAAVAAALLLGVCGMMAAARPPVPEKGPEPEPKPSAATMFKAHVEGRLWVIQGADADRKTLDLGHFATLGLGVVKVMPGAKIDPQLPPGVVRGVPTDAPAVTLDGRPAKLADLKCGMMASVETAPGKAAIRRITAFRQSAGEMFTLKAIDRKRRTVQLVSLRRETTLDAVPLAKEVEVVAYKIPVVMGVGGGFMEVGPAKPMPATLDDVKPDTAVSVELAFEGGQMVVKKLSIDMK